MCKDFIDGGTWTQGSNSGFPSNNSDFSWNIENLNTYRLVGTSSDCVDIDIECKNIPISAVIGGVYIVYQKVKIWDTEKVFFSCHIPNRQQEVKSTKTNHGSFHQKRDPKLQKPEIKV